MLGNCFYQLLSETQLSEIHTLIHQCTPSWKGQNSTSDERGRDFPGLGWNKMSVRIYNPVTDASKLNL